MATAFLTQKQRAALKVIDLAKALALADNHFLSAAVGRLRVQPAQLGRSFATDGFALAFDADKVCADFVNKQVAPKHDLMHTVLHCVFLHPYIAPNINAPLWDLACDIAVERNVIELCGRRSGDVGNSMSAVIFEVEKKLKGNITAEKIYRALCSGTWSAAKVDAWSSVFLRDDHKLWYAWNDSPDGGEAGDEAGDGPGDGPQADGPGDPQRGDSDSAGSRGGEEQNGDGSSGDPDNPNNSDNPDNSDGNAEGPGQGSGAGSSSKNLYASRAGLRFREITRPTRDVEEDGWRRVAKALAVNLQTYAKGRGKALDGMVSELEETTHERVDYADFLRQFATPGEVLRVSDDEFDYVFYTYGLKLYGNLPLIEPLEYREEKRIREFVIVIDTSGSVYGEIVKRFIDATFDILKSTEAFFERVHVRIIQCDEQVQSDDVVTSLEELKEWGNTMKIHGCGGTDFRPAFAYVDKLVEEGAFENLGGLVYFTDGWGDYPEWMPDYKVAFVFYDEDYRPEIVPTWAAQIVLDDHSIT